MTTEPYEYQTASVKNAIVLDDRADNTIVNVIGEVDLTSAADLADAIEAAGKMRLPVVVDLRLATYIDSTTLSVLLRAKSALPSGFSVALPSDGPVRRVFEITALLHTMPIAESFD